MRLAPVTEKSPTGSARGMSPPRRPCACAATSRADTGDRGVPASGPGCDTGGGRLGFFAGGLLNSAMGFGGGCREPSIMGPGGDPYKARFVVTPPRLPRQSRFCATKSQLTSLSITASRYAARRFW